MRIRSIAAVAAALAGLGLSTRAHAQAVPPTMHFTGRLATAEGAPIDGQRNLVLRLFDAPTGGAEVWTETHNGARFTQGLVYLTLGGSRDLDATVLDGGALYLEIVVDGTPMSPRLAVGSVPYAMRTDTAAVAETAATLGTILPTDVITQVTAGSGLAGGGTGSAVSLSLQPCADNHFLAAAGAGWACRPVPSGDIGAVAAGPGLVGGGADGDVTLAVGFTAPGGDSGTGTLVARGDHLHDGRYFTEAELSMLGTINAPANPVDWSRLKGVPGGFADGVDGDTLYTNGAGLSLAGTVFSAAFTAAGGDNGAAATVARGDHAHDGRYPIQSGRGGGQVITGGTGAGEDLVLRSTQSPTRGEIYLGDDGSAVSIGGGAPSATLDVNGETRSNDILKVGTAAPVAIERSHQRYIVEAPPASVGVVVPLDSAITDRLCRDRDGCEVSIAMVNFDQPGQPGNVAHRQMRMYASETSRWWRFSDNVGEPSGIDGSSGVQEIRAWDCFFGDAETYTGTVNGRADATVGLALLNCAGCDYSDATTTCRVVIED